MFSTNPTPLDLVFWLGRIPVRVIPTFWLMAFLLGRFQEGLDLVFIWMLCVFFSILIHELGHALVAEAFGYESEIVLHHFGGEARFNPGYRLPASRSLLISLAGPCAQLAFAAVLVVVPSALAAMKPVTTGTMPLASNGRNLASVFCFVASNWGVAFWKLLSVTISSVASMDSAGVPVWRR